MPGMIWLVIALPLLGAAINGTVALVCASTKRAAPKMLVSLLGVGLPFLAFFIAARFFYVLASFDAGEFAPAIPPLYTWVAFSDWVLQIGVRTDQLSMVMVLVVTGVGSLIHLFSIGYMEKDPGYARYFAYLNLFLFFMLLLVLGDNLLVMFVGWEGVGLCSYLLIGFWFTDAAKAYAGKKAFVVNRIGDFGFMLGILLIWVTIHNAVEPGSALLNFEVIKQVALQEGNPLIPAATAICLCLFVGACGKSAQIPLYVWLPDAMAGPTPVSALIHAATMVTAGVYMIARLNFLYALTPLALTVVAWTGCITALFAATMGLVQDDIKKVLAYSTVSQLGFMFIGVGTGAFSAGIFHLMTHAFFKALLFLGAGAVIHAMHHEQRLSAYGGLRKYLPITFTTCLVATCAIAGIYPFAGFYSKDAILWSALHPPIAIAGHTYIWGLGILAAGLTSFYMFRMMGLAFFGPRSEAGKQIHCHKEDSVTMLVPLVILAVLSFVGGWIGVPKGFGGADHFHHFLAPVFVHQPHLEHDESLEMLVGLGTMLWGSLWAIVALAIYAGRSEAPARMAARFKGWYYVLVHNYFVDEIYDRYLIRPLVWVSREVLWKIQDALLIDRIGVHGTGRVALLLGRMGAAVETGATPHYIFAMILGAVVMLWWMIL
ncbi:MAG: NADH-quinone oxidoreductase subunit L [Deltaproteobacteria bacterium]|nr:NADH-quinone oxidoreductase subunit L [Deltaproteobacteria bacterium]